MRKHLLVNEATGNIKAVNAKEAHCTPCSSSWFCSWQMFPQQQHSRRSNRHRTYVEEQSPCETGPADDGDNQFQPTVSDTFTTYRDRAGRERGDGDDESEDDVVVTPIPRRSRVRRTNSLLSIEFTEMGQQIGTLRSVRPQLGAEFGKRRHSDAMTMAIDSPDIMVGTPDRPSDRRLSVSNSGKGMSRIQALLKEETQHIAKEIAHERALNLASASYTLDVMDEEIPSDLLANSSFTTQRSKIEEEVSAIVPVPVRTVAIPNSALKDPATYISHSSKLNPENSFLSRQQEVISCSPSLSPVHTTFAAAISMSPGNAERKGKRKHSGDSERYEPYSKRHHRMPSSPTVQSPSIGTGAYFRASSTPPPFSLPFPLVFQRQRSPSVSSTSSVSSMWGVEKNGGNASHTNGSGYAMSTVASTSVPTGLPGSAHLMLGTTPPPASPKALGAFLNLGGTQEGFTKMSITE